MTTSIIPIQGYTWPPFIPAFSSSCVLRTVAGMCIQSGDGGNLPWLADCSHPDTHTLIPQQIPAGRDKTRAHHEQLALPCSALPGAPEPLQLRLPAGSELHTLPACRFVRKSEGEGPCLPHGQQWTTHRKDWKCSGHSKKNKTISDGKCVPGSSPLFVDL